LITIYWKIDGIILFDKIDNSDLVIENNYQYEQLCRGGGLSKKQKERIAQKERYQRRRDSLNSNASSICGYTLVFTFFKLKFLRKSSPK